MTRLGLISDPHASAAPVAEALALFKQHQVDGIWCTGDIAGYGDELEATLTLLQNSHCLSILGNHELWYLDSTTSQSSPATQQYLQHLPRYIHQTFDGKSVYMVHASPPDSLMDGIRLLDQSGTIIEAEKAHWTQTLHHLNYDVLIVGHTHQVFAEQLGSTLVINPGSTRFNHSCAILNFPDLTVQWFALSGQPIKKSWNWGIQAGQQT